MTIYQVAELANVNEKTVRSWLQAASVKHPELLPRLEKAMSEHVKAEFSVSEVLAIVRESGRTTLASLLEENIAKSLPPPRPKALNGKQLEYLYRFYKDKALSPYQIQLFLGIAVPRKDSLPEVPVSAAEAEKLFRQLGNIAKNGQPQLSLGEGGMPA